MILRFCQFTLIILTSLGQSLLFAAEQPVALTERSIGVGAGELSQTVFGLAVVVGILFLASFFLERTKLLSAGSDCDVSVVKQIPISVKEKLLVLQIGDEKILVGNAAGNMRTLHRWASPATEELESKSPAVFSQLIQKQLSAANKMTVIRSRKQEAKQ